VAPSLLRVLPPAASYAASTSSHCQLASDSTKGELGPRTMPSGTPERNYAFPSGIASPQTTKRAARVPQSRSAPTESRQPLDDEESRARASITIGDDRVPRYRASPWFCQHKPAALAYDATATLSLTLDRTAWEKASSHAERTPKTIPPSTAIFAPVTYLEASDASQRTAPTTSSG